MHQAAAGLEESQNLRLRIVGLVVLTLMGALLLRLWYLQVLASDEFQAEASANILRIVHEEAPRGRIFDAKGRILVDNEFVYAVMMDRSEFGELDDGEQTEVIVELASLLSRSGHLTKAINIEERLDSHEFGPFDKVPVALDISPDLLVYLGERHSLFPGVSVGKWTIRSYPYGNLAAHVLGYVGQINADEYRARLQQINSSSPGAKTYRIGDEIGKSGVERVFEDELRGVPGQRVFEVNAFNEIVVEHGQLRREPLPGNDLHLTIDIDLQHLIERELRRGLDKARTQPKPADQPDAPDFKAAAAAAVALDPRNGSILAMASFPTYDPGELTDGISQRLFDQLTAPENYAPILNRAIQGEYAPGSTFKPVTAYASMTQGVIGGNADALIDVADFYTDTGVYRYPLCLEESVTCIFRSPYCCERGVDLRDAIAVSSDTYFYRLGGEGFFQRRPPRDEGIQTAARLFGLGKKSGVPLPYERSGVVPDRDYYDRLSAEGVFQRGGDEWYAGDTVNLAIGQGTLLTTPLQMANVYAVLASSGRLHQPNIAWKITDHNGDVLKEFGPRLVDEVSLPANVLEPLMDGLNGTTSYHLPGSSDAKSILTGTAYNAFNRPEVGGVDFPLVNWPVAGKTGTSEKTGKADSAWFVGFGPASWPERGLTNTPEIVVAMVFEEAGFGGIIAAPAVARFLKPVAYGAVDPASTAQEVDACRVEVQTLTIFLEGVRIGAIKVDEDGEPISEKRPKLSQTCSEMVGGERAVESRGLDALP